MSEINGLDLINGSVSGGSKPVLLWTNSNPSVDFSAQTISLDLSSYDSVWISWKIGWPGAYDADTIIPMGSTIRIDRHYFTGESYYYYDAFYRSATVATNGVTFSVCLHLNAIENGIYNRSNVPQKIYGMNVYS